MEDGRWDEKSYDIKIIFLWLQAKSKKIFKKKKKKKMPVWRVSYFIEINYLSCAHF